MLNLDEESLKILFATKDSYLRDFSTETRRDDNILEEYKSLLYKPSNSMAIFDDKIFQLRKLVLKRGLPRKTENDSSIRPIVWKLLLGAFVVDAAHYLSLIKDGPTISDEKIRNDTFRTFNGDQQFWDRVTEASMARVLNAFVRNYFRSTVIFGSTLGCSSTTEANSGHASEVAITNQHIRGNQRIQNLAVEIACVGTSVDSKHEGYVQGMNILAAPFLFVMNELDAFTCFSELILSHCPRYVAKNLDGVHHGCSLVGRCLKALDPTLHHHITSRMQIQIELFAFPIVMTLFGSVRPLEEVLVVWDALFAFGVHFNVILCAVHLILMRDRLLAERNSYRLQKEIRQEPLVGQLLVTCSLQMCQFIDEDLYNEIVAHPVDPPITATRAKTKENLDRGPIRTKSASRPRTRACDDSTPPTVLTYAKKSVQRRELPETARSIQSDDDQSASSTVTPASLSSRFARPHSSTGVRRKVRGKTDFGVLTVRPTTIRPVTSSAIYTECSQDISVNSVPVSASKENKCSESSLSRSGNESPSSSSMAGSRDISTRHRPLSSSLARLRAPESQSDRVSGAKASKPPWNSSTSVRPTGKGCDRHDFFR